MNKFDPRPKSTEVVWTGDWAKAPEWRGLLVVTVNSRGERDCKIYDGPSEGLWRIYKSNIFDPNVIFQKFQ